MPEISSNCGKNCLLSADNQARAHFDFVCQQLAPVLIRFSPISLRGKLTEVNISSVKARLPAAFVGQRVQITLTPGQTLQAQVLSVALDEVRLAVFGRSESLRPGLEVKGAPVAFNSVSQASIAVPHFLLGSLTNCFGEVEQRFAESRSTEAKWDSVSTEDLTNSQILKTPRALARRQIDTQFVTGVRAIDSFIPLGFGQRIMVVAEPGVGKSHLIASIAMHSLADVNIIALIGERGREVEEFTSSILSPEAWQKTILVASTSDEAPTCRAQAGETALQLAESLRAKGLNVLLVVDSLTRLARAHRDLGLAAGQVPVRRGYPTSSFEFLPPFIERAGNTRCGSITAVYSILASGEFDEDPLVQEVKGLVDGHIMLSAARAERGLYPAIDITRSLSRLQHNLLEAEELKNLSLLRRLLSRLEHDRDILAFGGLADSELGAAIKLEPAIDAFLQQNCRQKATLVETKKAIQELCLAYKSIV